MSTARLSGALLTATPPVVLIALWWIVSADSASLFFPPLSDIVARFREVWLFDRFTSDVVPSLARMGAGYALGAVVGIALGVVLGLVAPIRRALDPLLHFARALPGIGLVPVMLLLFGTGDTGKVVLIAFAVTWPILLNTIDGVRSVDPTLRDVCSAFGLTQRQRIVRVVLPSSAPRIAVGLRTSLAIALILMIISEMVAATNGVGYFTIQAQSGYDVLNMWTGMLLLGLLGVVLNQVFITAERRALWWYHGLKGGRSDGI